MNWSAVRLIASREILDLLRDRRSVILLVFLPVILYPGLALLGFYSAVSINDHLWRIGVVNINALTVTPPLVVDGKFALQFAGSQSERESLQLVPLATADPEPLNNRTIDVMLVVPGDLKDKLAKEEQSQLELIRREGDESSKIAERRVQRVLTNYEDAIRHERFVRHNLPDEFDSPIKIHTPQDDQPPAQRSSDELRDRLANFLPFLLVMWALAGSLHPAIDVCAGEKERGTMETLLLCPAKRSEIVTGKLMAVGAFSLGTALWNLLWMSGLAFLGARLLHVNLRLNGLIWCGLLAIPLSILFSALSIALGVFARSTKEGQYYLLPLFVGVMPLVLLSTMPSMELTWATSLIPVTGACLLLTRLLGPASDAGTLLYMIPVAISMTICVVAACAWAVAQFHRESVLFREAEGEAIRMR